MVEGLNGLGYTEFNVKATGEIASTFTLSAEDDDTIRSLGAI